jgi:cytochrome c biogenesis protein CcdA/thiol-disulfide isomerase/thioredoxin
MLLLMLFAVIAGAGTAITPCVLPVLPALLSASALGGRRRPLGIVLGLAGTFTVAIVALAQLVKGVGLAGGAARWLAIVVLVGFGIVLLVPAIAERVQAPLSRLARFGPRRRGDGFWSGVGVGGALGFVCAPCAGPILAAVTSVSASSGASPRIVAVALAYSGGLAAVMLLYAIGGRAVVERIRRRARGPVVERSLGVVLLVTAGLMAANLDVRFEEALARDTSLPAFLVDPTRSLESSHAVQSRLASLRPPSRFGSRQAAAGNAASTLPRLGPAPEFTGTERWFNTPGGAPLTLAGLRGRVVLVDFWTYTCINCLRTLPFLKGLYATYHPYGLQIVGVETPEFTFEQDAGNVAQAIRADGLRYPVVQDNQYGTWNAYGNQYWPAEYLIDARGQVRHVQFGEGDYAGSEQAVRSLLREAGAPRLPSLSGARAQVPSAQLATPETYLDPRRAQGFLTPLLRGSHVYPGAAQLALNQFALRGPWQSGSESITAAAPGAEIQARVRAADVYLVLTSPHPQRVQVLLDGRPIPPADAGRDVRSGSASVSSQRLYWLVHRPSAETHSLTVRLPPSVSAYDFTFG